MECSGAAELGLALDVDDAAGPQPHARGDPARPTEGKRPELQHREAVDLADLGAVGIDQHDAAVDGLLRPVAKTVGALDLLVDGPADVLSARDLALGLARPVVGLAHDVGDAPELDRQLLAVVGQPRAFVDDAGDARRVHRLETVLLDHRCDQRA